MSSDRNYYVGDRRQTARQNPSRTAYETYENPQTVQPAPDVCSRNLPEKGSSNEIKRKKMNCQTVFNIFASIMLTLCAISILLIYTKPTGVSSTPEEQGGTPETRFKSCQELLTNGFASSGVYEIAQKAYGVKTFQVYCDMTTNGGGWTLVASIHRSEDDSKCSNNDKWSYYPYSSYRRSNGIGSPSWSDENLMGSVYNATSDDYKNPGYFAIKSSDVMLSHVPNNADITELDSKSFLKYFTENNFLVNYGSSLRNLYSDYVPLNSLDILGLDFKVVAQMKTQIDVASIITGWYNYIYDTGTSGTSINDGGRNMFDVGNQVYFRLNNEPYTQLQYGKAYTDSKTYHISSAANYPFIALASVTNFDGYPNKFTMKVVSNTSTGGILRYDWIHQTRNGVYVEGIMFHSYNSPGKPSVTSVMFWVRSYEKWGSSYSSTSYPSTYPLSSTNLTYEFSLTGSIRNIMMGYMLLSRNDSSYVARSEVQTLLYKIVDLLDLPENSIVKLNPPQPQVATLVKFVKGSISYTGNNVTAGYLQFGAYDHFGYPYALCPGVRVNEGADPSQFCIGSADTSSYHRDRCGDFSAWETLRDHVFLNRSVSNNRKFLNDLHSTILIFIR